MAIGKNSTRIINKSKASGSSKPVREGRISTIKSASDQNLILGVLDDSQHTQIAKKTRSGTGRVKVNPESNRQVLNVVPAKSKSRYFTNIKVSGVSSRASEVSFPYKPDSFTVRALQKAIKATKVIEG